MSLFQHHSVSLPGRSLAPGKWAAEVAFRLSTAGLKLRRQHRFEDFRESGRQALLLTGGLM